MKYTLIILLLSYGITKAQTNIPVHPNTDRSFYINDVESHFDSVAIHKYIAGGKPALILSNKSDSVTCINLSKDDVGINITAMLRKKGSPLTCPWPYTRLEGNKRTK